MPTTLSIARQKLLELLRMTPERHMREGYVLASIIAAIWLAERTTQGS